MRVIRCGTIWKDVKFCGDTYKISSIVSLELPADELIEDKKLTQEKMSVKRKLAEKRLDDFLATINDMLVLYKYQINKEKADVEKNSNTKEEAEPITLLYNNFE